MEYDKMEYLMCFIINMMPSTRYQGVRKKDYIFSVNYM